MSNKNLVGAVLACCLVIGFMAVIVVLFFVAIPTENENLLNQLVIALVTLAGVAVNYFLGSSKGSADKSDQLAVKSAPVLPPDGSAPAAGAGT